MQHTQDLPNKAMPTAVIEIVSYLDEDGNMKWSWTVDGQPPVMQVIGLLESLQQILVHQILGAHGPAAE